MPSISRGTLLGLLLVAGFYSTKARIFERCEFGFELVDEGIEANDWRNEIPKWLCIANHSTGFDTNFYDDSAPPLKIYGILKISNDWCDDGDGSRNRCGVPCSDLQGDNITETVQCANQIFREAGNSFVPWYPAWQNICMNEDSTPYIVGCERAITFTSGGVVEVVEGENFTLTCSVKGYPSPTLSWDWDGEPDDHITISPPGLIDIKYTLSLNFQPVKREDIKTYTCHAENLQGSNSTTFELRFAEGSSTTESTDATTESESTTEITSCPTTQTTEITSGPGPTTTESATPTTDASNSTVVTTTSPIPTTTNGSFTTTITSTPSGTS